MTESLWSARADELLAATASAAPTPGGGAIAAVAGAFGVGLVRMAIAITGDADALGESDRRLAALTDEITRAADTDARDFDAVMQAYRLPADDDASRAARTAAITAASVAATESPLALVTGLVEALRLSHQIEPLVKKSIVSDVLAGRDIIAGAARAGIRTADINLSQLERAAAPEAAELRARRDELARAVEDSA